MRLSLPFHEKRNEAMARNRPSRRPQGTADDAFTARTLEFVAWVRNNTQTAIIGLIAIVLLVGGTIYFLTQRSVQYEQAAAQLEVVQGTVATSPTPEAIAEIESYLARFGGTPYGLEARLLLAEIHLEEGNPDRAIDTLLEAAPSYRTSLGLQATFLLAIAYEDAERWEEAEEVYEALKERGEYTFQRREAGEGLARVLLAQGDSVGAKDAFRALIAQEEAESPYIQYFEMRLAELTRGEG